MSSNTHCSGFLDSEGIQRLVWPARFSDLNPIENVWDVLGRQVAGRNYPPTNKNTLIRALTEKWDKLPQHLLDNVAQNMVRRVECCIRLHGGHIPQMDDSQITFIRTTNGGGTQSNCTVTCMMLKATATVRRTSSFLSLTYSMVLDLIPSERWH
ncbi:transposable element Tc3 transposase [Trichonephila clavipes]|nr:transposable element Tc3 transposase [Trichonephila clavipes]